MEHILQIRQLSIFSFSSSLRAKKNFLRVTSQINNRAFICPRRVFTKSQFMFTSSGRSNFFFTNFLSANTSRNMILPTIKNFRSRSKRSLRFPEAFTTQGFQDMPDFMIPPPRSTNHSMTNMNRRDYYIKVRFPSEGLYFFFQARIANNSEFRLYRFTFKVIFRCLMIRLTNTLFRVFLSSFLQDSNHFIRFSGQIRARANVTMRRKAFKACLRRRDLVSIFIFVNYITSGKRIMLNNRRCLISKFHLRRFTRIMRTSVRLNLCDPTYRWGGYKW